MKLSVAENPVEPDTVEAVHVKLVATKLTASKKTQEVSLSQVVMTWSSGPSLVSLNVQRNF